MIGPWSYHSRWPCGHHTSVSGVGGFHYDNAMAWVTHKDTACVKGESTTTTLPRAGMPLVGKRTSCNCARHGKCVIE